MFGSVADTVCVHSFTLSTLSIYHYLPQCSLWLRELLCLKEGKFGSSGELTAVGATFK